MPSDTSSLARVFALTHLAGPDYVEAQHSSRTAGLTMLIYEKPGYIRVAYNQDRHVIVFQWENFTVTLKEIQELHERALAVAQEKGCYYYIAETSRVSTVLPADVFDGGEKFGFPSSSQRDSRRS